MRSIFVPFAMSLIVFIGVGAIFYGLRTSSSAGASSTLTAPHFGGYTDTVVMHTVDLQLSFPAIPVVLDPVASLAMERRRSASARPLPGRPRVCRARKASATCRAMTTGSASIPGSRS